MKSISEEIIQKVIESLEKNEMEATYFPSVEEAKGEVLKRISPDPKVGIGE